MEISLLDKLRCVTWLFKITIITILVSIGCITLKGGVYCITVLFVFLVFVIELNCIKSNLIDVQNTRKISKSKKMLFSKYEEIMKKISIVRIDFKEIELTKLEYEKYSNYYQYNIYAFLLLSIILGDRKTVYLENTENLNKMYFSYADEVLSNEIEETITSIMRENYKKISLAKKTQEKYEIMKQKISLYYDD